VLLTVRWVHGMAAWQHGMGTRSLAYIILGDERAIGRAAIDEA
jgi:hypothetical protein